MLHANDFASHSKPGTSGANQRSLLGSLLLLFHVDDVSNVVRNGVQLPFADEIKIVYIFQPVALGCTVAEIIQDLITLNI